MNIQEAKEEIIRTIKVYTARDEDGMFRIPSIQQRPLLLMGPPGIGKTAIVEQAAAECGTGMLSYAMTHHTRQSAIGLPELVTHQYEGKKYTVTEYTMSEIVASVYVYMEQTGYREGVLFLDEINCASETLAPVMLQLLQFKKFGTHKVPEGWIIVAAGNPPEYNKSVREFDVVTLDRIKMIHVEPDYQVWKEYAVNAAVHPAVISYLEARKEHFYRIESTVSGRQFATPRGWEDLARLIEVYEKLGKTVDREVTAQYIENPRIAKDFAAYLELYYKYQSEYQIGAILSGTVSEAVISRASRAAFDERFSVVNLILSHLNGEFREAGKREEMISLLFGRLKEIRDERDLSLLERLARELDEEAEKQRKAGLIDREQEYLMRSAAERLEKYAGILKKEGGTEFEPGFERVRELFLKDREAYESCCDETLQKLERGFDFLEAAFGDSQEMVLFVTGLTASRSGVGFLREHECERYYEYNRRLLFEDQESGILERLNRLEERG